MNEVQLKTIQDCQARISELRKPENGGIQANRAEIEKLNQMIADAISGKAEENNGKVVETSTVDISSEMGATFSAKVRTADQEFIDETKKRSGKYNEGGKDAANREIVETYGYRDENGVLLTKEQAEAKLEELNKEKKRLEKQLKTTQKAWEKASKSGAANADALEEQYDQLSEQYQEFKYQYDKDVAALRINAGKKGAVKGIRKAADHNVKNYQNVQEVSTQQAFKTEAEEEAYLRANPQAEGKTFHLEDNELRALKQLQKYGKKQIAKAQKEYDENPGPETEKKLKDAKGRYGHYADMFDADGNIDTKAVQDVLVDYAGGDQNLNLDEKRLLKKRLNVGDSNFVSEGDVKSLYKRFGFGTESGLKSKFRAAGIAAGGAAVGNALGALMGTTHSHKSASASDHKIVEGESVSKTVKWEGPDGSIYKTTITAAGGTAEAFAEATAEACAKIPIVGQLAGPVLAGVTAFLLTKGKTEDAFNGASVEAVLEDLSLVKNADNQAIINKIQDLPLDDRIKAAVLKASMGDGVTANTEELERAYHDMVKTQEVIGKLDVEEPEKVEEPPKQEEKPEPDPIKRVETSEEIPVEFNVKHKSGMGPYQYAEALGVPNKHIGEFIKMFRDDNNMDRQGTKFNRTPKLRNEYTFKDGTTFKPGTKDEAQAKIDAYKVAKPKKPVKGTWRPVQGKDIATITRKNGRWVWATDANGHKAGDPVPAAQLKKHPTYIKWCEDNGVQP